MAKLSVDLKPAWKTKISDSGDLDILPLCENHEAGAKCSCAPTVEVIGAHLLIVHNSFDHREVIEQAIAIMNGGL